MSRTSFEKLLRAVRRHGERCKNLKCRQTLALIGSALIQFSVGTVTSLGNQVTYIVSFMRKHGAQNSSIRYSDFTILVFFGMLVTGFASIPMGYLAQKTGGWQAAAMGSFLYTSSFLVSYIALESYFSVYYIAALMMAFGVTLATIGALTEAIKWVPRWEGMVNGINYGAFAAAPAIVNPLVTMIVNPKNKSPKLTPYLDKNEKYFGNEDVLKHVPSLFGYGVVGLIVVQVVGIALLARYPCQPSDAENEDEETHSIVSETTESSNSRSRKCKNEPKQELEVKEALNLPIFWKIYILFAFALAPVLTALTTYKVYGQGFIDDDFFLSKVGGSLGIAKGTGAFVWGILADFLDLEGLIVIMTVIITIATILVYVASLSGKVLYAISFVVLFLAGGGLFSLYPVVLVRYFGRNNFAVLYGVALTTIAVAAAIMAVVTLGYSKVYKGYLIFWGILAFFSSLSVWIALYLYVLDYRGVRPPPDVRTVSEDVEITRVERNVPAVEREVVNDDS